MPFKCSAKCGGGIKRREIRCQFENGSLSQFCSIMAQPKLYEACNQEECPRWIVENWTECSKKCGLGFKKRQVICARFNKTISDTECRFNQRPSEIEQCLIMECPKWHTGEWTECDINECKMIRHVNCKFDNNTIAPDNGLCDFERKPEETRECECPKVIIHYSPWSTCNASCNLTGYQTRHVYCRLNNTNSTYVNIKRCNITQNTEIKTCCEEPKKKIKWRITHWSKCSTECGFGNRTRKVFCMTGNTLLNETLCKHLPKPISQQACLESSCGYAWVTGSWSQCSKTCSTGIRFRDVACVKISSEGFILNGTSNKCSNESKPTSEELCNYGECSAGYRWSVDLWSNVILLTLFLVYFLK